MAKFKMLFTSFRMKRWSGGMLIMALAVILIFRYSLIAAQPQKERNQPQKHRAYDFFRNHPANDSRTKSSISVKSPKMEVKKMQKPVKKPHLINVDGLDDLFAPRNVSEEESNSLLVWTHMRFLLSRSDSLPEMAQGIKEAAIVWKDLLSVIERDKVSKSSDNDKTRNRTCPFSVRALDQPLSNDRLILELPCGLVEDSSITLIGIPDGKSRSFHIELVGSQLSGEPSSPIVLHYNVSLPGGNMTEEPFIVQNTWTSELGWGKEERCPSHGSANSQTGTFSFTNLDSVFVGIG